MKTMKKALVVALAGVMMVAALALSGCFGFGGGGNGGSGGGSSSSGIVGTWKLDYAHDFYGNAYDISQIGSDKVVLKVTSETKATFYYFDDDPFSGTMERYAAGDSEYASDGYTSKCYHLVGSDGSYWEFAYVVPDDSSSEPFFYLEVGASQPDSIYLSK